MFLVVHWVMKRALLVYICASLAILLFFATDLPNEIRLMREGEVVAGKVVVTNCDQHQSFRYRFAIDGATYQGTSMSSRCVDLSRGDEVLVHYLPVRPEVHMVGDPEPPLVNDAVTAGAAALVMPALLILIFWAKKRALSKSEQG